jgi:ubiquitin carboxyl-terminal hydrolase L3
MTDASKKEPEWLPLESNPDVMNAFLRELGVPSGWAICDVYGTDPELLAMVPRPTIGLILLFPLTKDAAAGMKSTTAVGSCEGGSDKVYYMKQKISNACGTIALVHLVANSEKHFKVAPNSTLGKFLELTKGLDPEKRGIALADDNDFRSSHEKVAHEGQTAAPSPEEAAKVDLHFVAFVPSGGKIWELDGRKEGPVCHGDTTDDTFLEDGIKVCKGFMEANPQENRFTIVALAKD